MAAPFARAPLEMATPGTTRTCATCARAAAIHWATRGPKSLGIAHIARWRRVRHAVKLAAAMPLRLILLIALKTLLPAPAASRSNAAA